MTAGALGVPRFRVHPLVWIGLAAVAAFALGIYGFAAHFADLGTRVSLFDMVYCSLALFLGDFHGQTGPKPLALMIAMLLAPAVTSSTVILGLMKLAGERFRLMRFSHHAVVCGLGREGSVLAKGFLLAGCRTVVVEPDEDNSAIEICRSMGAIVLIGDPADMVMLHAARVEKASRLVAACSEDAVNIEIAMIANELTAEGRPARMDPLKCFISIVDLKWCASFRALGVFRTSEKHFLPIAFSPYEHYAREAMEKHPLDRERITAHDPRQVHLVISGWNDMSEALALQTMQSAHFANLRKPRITVVCPNAAEARAGLATHCPQADIVADLRFVAADIGDATARHELAALAADRNALVTVAVCTGNETHALSAALALPQDVRDAHIPVLVRLSEEMGLARFLEHARHGANLHAFGILREDFKLGEETNILAEALHRAYVAKAVKDGRSSETDPAMLPWDLLDEGFRDSNRRAADHIPVKLRAVGCALVPKTQAPEGASFTFTADEVELMARMEHARWCAERLLAGWRLGPADKPRKVTPYLVPYDQLDEKIKDYDRAPARDLPQLLWQHAGMGLTRGRGQTGPRGGDHV